MKMLITGGAGFVGTNLAVHLSKNGHEVVVYDNLSRTQGNVNHLAEHNCHIVRGELDDIHDLLRKETFDIIYHLAAQVAVTTSYENPRSDFRINTLGTFNLLMNTKTPVIYASTNKVYGDNVNNVPIVELPARYDFDGDYKKKGIHEEFSIDARHHTPYGCSKLFGDILVREHLGVVNRFSCLYGPHQYGSEDQGWVAHFVRSKVENLPVRVYGDGKQVRDLLFVEDVVELLAKEAEKIDAIRGEVFNIGGGYENTLSILELCKELKLEPTFHPERPADQKVYYSDVAKAKKVLGWSPSVGVKEGLERLIDWIRQQKRNL